jgi:nitroimidazol reductase NimA-like FMN-containing flavoprotein (pyridoxamine 5'-phosphate oxidase superfamily)
MEDELRAQIEEYIKSHNVCTIAVADGAQPSTHTMYYVCHGLHIYLESDPQSQKVHVLKANPRIALTIDEDYEDWREIKGIQLMGKVNFADERHAPKLQAKFMEKFPHINDLGGIPQHHVFIEVIPEKIYYMDFTKKFGHKSVYYIEDMSSKINW